jgi:hypothetical protein
MERWRQVAHRLDDMPQSEQRWMGFRGLGRESLKDLNVLGLVDPPLMETPKPKKKKPNASQAITVEDLDRCIRSVFYFKDANGVFAHYELNHPGGVYAAKMRVPALVLGG